MALIDHYYHFGDGYDPFLITTNWQVAQLNHSKVQDVANIETIERHNDTDEVFVLIKGRAVLIAAKNVPGAIWFETTEMKTGVTYNVPKGMWHTIVTVPGTEIIIVENAQTHLHDVEYYQLESHQRKELQKKIGKLL